MMNDMKPDGTMKPFRAWWFVGYEEDEVEADWRSSQTGGDGIATFADPVTVLHLPNYREADVLHEGSLKRVPRSQIRIQAEDVI